MTAPVHISCGRCREMVDREQSCAGLCGPCFALIAQCGAILLRVDRELAARGVPHDARAAMLRGLVLQRQSLEDAAGQLAPSSLAKRAVELELPHAIAILEATADARLEGLATIGAGAWERWAADAYPYPERISRLVALRPYRRQVVRLILDELTTAGVVWH